MTNKYNPGDEAMEEAIRRATEDRAFRKELVAKNHYLFGRVYFQEAMFAPTAAFQREMFELAQREKQLLVIAGFRGCAKSLILAQCYPLFAAMTQGKHNILIFGNTQNQAQEKLANIRSSLENGPLLRKDFGPFRAATDAWNRSSLIIPGYDVKITAVSMEQHVRGITYKQYRSDLIIGDDIQDMDSVQNQEARNKNFDFLQSEIVPLGGPGTQLIIVGNLLHHDSTIMRLVGAIEKKQIRGTFRKYPLIDADGKNLWPERYTPDVLAAESAKYIDDIAWEREMNLRFVTAPDVVVKREWIKSYAAYPNGEYITKYAIGVDPAISKRQTADCTAIVSVIVCNSGDETKLFVLPWPFNARVNFPETIGEIKARYAALADRMRPVDVFIENVAYQASLPDYFNLMDNLPVKGLRIPLDKRGRFTVLGDLIKRGKIVFPDTGCELLIEQLVNFGAELHDDLADALALLAFAVIPDPYPSYTAPRAYTYPGMGPLFAESHEEIMAIMRDPDRRSELEREADMEIIDRQMKIRGLLSGPNGGGSHPRQRGWYDDYPRHYTF